MMRWRRKLAITALVVVAAAPFAWFVSLRLQRGALDGEIEAARADTAMAQRRLDAAQPSALASLPTGAEAAGRWRLPAVADVTETLQALEAHAEDCHVELTGLEARPGTDDNRVRFLIRGRASPVALCSMMASIEQNARLLVVDSGSVSADDGASVTFALTVSAWCGGGER